jgi:hypothetical protein
VAEEEEEPDDEPPQTPADHLRARSDGQLAETPFADVSRSSPTSSLARRARRRDRLLPVRVAVLASDFHVPLWVTRAG